MWRPLRDFLKQLLRSGPGSGEDPTAFGPLQMWGASELGDREPQGELGNAFTSIPIQSFTVPLTGRVVKSINRDRPGQVSFRGTIWRAQSTVPLERRIPKRRTVIIVGRQGNTLLVLPPNR